MHELSICQSTLSQIEQIVIENNAVSVHAVHVQIGPLSGVDADLLIRAFPIASAGSVAEGAELVVETLPVRVRCNQCGAEAAVSTNRLLCPRCGDWRTTLLSGNEIILSSVELEK